MKYLYLLLATFSIGVCSWAQTANVQIIHNAPTPANAGGQAIDIYVNGVLPPALAGLAYLEATSFLPFPADAALDISIALSPSNSVDDAIASFSLEQLTTDENYIAMATGIVGSMEYPIQLVLKEGARFVAATADSIDVMVFSGSTDIEHLDIDNRNGSSIVGGLAYGSFSSSYKTIAPGDYYWDLRLTGNTNILVTYAAFLNDLAGSAYTVFTSGFFEDTPAFGTYVAFANGIVVPLFEIEIARIQLIQNTHSSNIDLYVDSILAIDNFMYRTAIPYIDFPAGVEINLGVAMENSSGVGDTLANFPVQFENGKTYVLVLNGIIGSTASPPALAITDIAQEAGTSPESIQVLAFHGSPGAPTFNINDFLDVPIITGFSYNNFTSSYLDLEATNYAFEVRPIVSSDLVGTFLTDFTGQENQSIVMLASGIEGDNPNFDLLAIYPDGTVIPFLPAALGQFIHNSPSPVAGVIDVWFNNAAKLIEDFTFLNATPLNFYATRIPYTIGLAGPDSEDPSEIITTLETPLTFEDGKYHIIVANGLFGSTEQPFELAVNTEGSLFADFPPNVDATFFHGTLGLDAIDIKDRELDEQVVDGLTYANFSEAVSLAISPDAYFLEISPDDSDELLYTFYAPINPDFSPFSITVLATGAIENDFPLSLLAYDPVGNVQAFTPVAEVQIINNSLTDSLDAYANGGIFLDSFAYRSATPFLNAPTRANIDFAFTPGTGQSVADSLISRAIRFEDGKKYVMMLTGIAEDIDYPMDIVLHDMAQTQAVNDDDVDVLFYHGATDAPAVDIVIEEDNIVFDDAAYGEYQGYENLAPTNYTMNVTPSDDNNNILKSYTADFSPYEGEATILFASGLLNSQLPEEAFELWVALEDGTTFPLSEIVSTEEVSVLVSSLQISPNPARNATRINYTLEKGTNVVACIFDANGKLLSHSIWGEQMPPVSILVP